MLRDALTWWQQAKTKKLHSSKRQCQSANFIDNRKIKQNKNNKKQGEIHLIALIFIFLRFAKTKYKTSYYIIVLSFE